MFNPELLPLIVSMFMELGPVTKSASWKNWPLDEQVKLSVFLNEFDEVFGTIKSRFDSAVWDGHANGTVDPTVESVRTKSKRRDDSGTYDAAAELEALRAKAVAK